MAKQKYMDHTTILLLDNCSKGNNPPTKLECLVVAKEIKQIHNSHCFNVNLLYLEQISCSAICGRLIIVTDGVSYDISGGFGSIKAERCWIKK